MKPLLTLLSILSFIILTATGCKKDKKTPLEQLPPETQTGANTFGCLIDGKAFKPKGNPLAGPVIKAHYQFVNGKQGFGISGSRSDDSEINVVGIFADSIIITEKNYELTSKYIPGKLHGRYILSKLGTLGNYYYTNEIKKGQISINHFDTINQIVSGTFWFDAIDTTTGKIVQIREGRFDLPYVR